MIINFSQTKAFVLRKTGIIGTVIERQLKGVTQACLMHLNQ